MSTLRRVEALTLAFVLFSLHFTIPVEQVEAEDPNELEFGMSWKQGDTWKYRSDDTELKPYTLFNKTYQNDSYSIETDVNLFPSDITSGTNYILSQVNTGTNEYQMTLSSKGWENGTWAAIITDTGGDPGYKTGDIFEADDYRQSYNVTGTSYYDMTNMNKKRGSTKLHIYYTDCQYEPSWTYTIDRDIEENGADPSYFFDPAWPGSSIKVGDEWLQDNVHTVVIDDGSEVITYTYVYNFTWNAAEISSKSVPHTHMGTNNYAKALKITRSGWYDWYRDNGTSVESGTIYPGPYEVWFARQGDQFDGGWVIEFNQTVRLYYSTYIGFINSPPELTTPPEPSYDIQEDQVWEFTNGNEYAVSDPDPNKAGELTYNITVDLNGNESVLPGLEINTDGDIYLEPEQEDVADGYIITVNVTDKYEDEPMSIEFSFILNIKNTNDEPIVDNTIMTDFEIFEGTEYTPTWNFSYAFIDPDMERNPLMGNEVYDPNEFLSYSVENNYSIRVKCPNGQDINIDNQCDQVTFEALDGKFPRTISITTTFTAKDRTGYSVKDRLVITIHHSNHDPVAASDMEDVFEMDEDTVEIINLKEYIWDIDVGNPDYQTNDQLNFKITGETNLTTQITRYKALIEPEIEWCGEDDIWILANDSYGATAEFNLTIDVICSCPAEFSFDHYPTTDSDIHETNDKTEGGDFESITFGILVNSDFLNKVSYNWTVEDAQTKERYEVPTHLSEFIFRTSFNGEFEDGQFHGGDYYKRYIVTSTISDGEVDVGVKKWNLTVWNVNRKPTISGIKVSILAKDGSSSPISTNTPGHYYLKYGKSYRLDVSNFITDLDEGIENGTGIENLDNLTLEWISDKDGTIGKGPYFDLVAGRASPNGNFKIKSRSTYVIRIRATDNVGDITEFEVTLKAATDQLCSEPKNLDPVLIIFLFWSCLALVILLMILFALLKRIGRYKD